jgi:hypothetical protein
MAPRLRPILLLCLLLGVSGCAWLQQTERSSLIPRQRGPALPQSDDLVTLDIAVIEKPLGDPYLNRELWTSTDDMLLDMEHKALVQKNGYRIGQVVGLMPEALQSLLKSERYCLNPRRRVVASGQRLTQFLGPVYPQAEFTLREGEKTTPLSLDQARFCLDVVPTRTKDNKVRLAFTPKVETGERMLPFQPDVAHSTWTLCVDKPARVFSNLSWEITVEPHKFLVVGTLLDQKESVGYRTFTQEEYPALQRLLVIRVASAGSAAGTPPLEDFQSEGGSVPLALQAAATGK